MTATTEQKNGHKLEPPPPNRDEQFIVKYRQDYYDISSFMKKHPGGLNTLRGLNNTDMTYKFLKAPPHSDAAMYLMREFKVPATAKMTQNGQNGIAKHRENGHVELVDEAQDEELLQLKSDKNSSNLDESMEHLVDWSKAMLPQIASITKYYDEWVHKPVDRPLRLFGPNYLEMLTKTPWWIIPTFWIPVIMLCLLNDVKLSLQSENATAQLTYLASYFVVGILFWTFLEYSLHRWVFHMKTDENSSPWTCTFHFMIHGLHHKVPFDSMRLVFPPVPGVVLASIIYAPLSVMVPTPRILLAGALCGYLCYDLMHYYLHYGDPYNLKPMYHMKRYHYQHHFAHQDIGYGISSPLWDFIFNTRIHLRKLRYTLRWK